MPSFRELLTATKSEIAEVTTAEAEELRADGAIVLDVREADEFEQGAIPGAVFIPRGHLEGQIENRIADKDAKIVVHCAGGYRSSIAASWLRSRGATDVSDLLGGFGAWADHQLVAGPA